MDDDDLTPPVAAPPKPRSCVVIRDPDGQIWVHEGDAITLHVKPLSSYLVEDMRVHEVTWDHHAGHWRWIA